MSYEAGQVHVVDYPFFRDTVELCDGPDESYYPCPTWVPGIRSKLVGNFGCVNHLADGMGKMFLAVVSVHKPGKYPTRIYFTRQWQDPDGKKFGRGKLHIVTQQKFTRLVGGYRHEFEMEEGLECE